MDDSSDEMSNSSDLDTSSQCEPVENGFLHFLREFSSNKYGIDVVEMTMKGGEAWSKLSNEQRKEFRAPQDPKAVEEGNKKTPNQVCADDDEDCDDYCCPPPPRGKCGQPAQRCCPPPRKPCCGPKRKTCCRKPKCCKRKKPCCRKPKRCCKPTCNIKCQMPNSVANNGYLNFLRHYRRKHCGVRASELVLKAARAWCRLPDSKKHAYRRLVRRA